MTKGHFIIFTPKLSLLWSPQFMRARSSWTCLAASPGFVWIHPMGWTLAWPCFGSCSLPPVPLSAGTDRCMGLSGELCKTISQASVSVSLPSSLSPLQERQFFPLLRLLFCVYLSVWCSRPANDRHHRLGNVVTVFNTLTHSVPLPASVSCSPTHFVSVFWSPSGWIAALTGLNTSIPVGIIMLLIAALFTALSVCSLIMFKKVSDWSPVTASFSFIWQVQHQTGQMKLSAMISEGVVFPLLLI